MRVSGHLCFSLLWASLGLSLQTLPAAMVIDGYTAAENHRFSNDPSFIAAAYDLSGVARSSSNKWGTLVSQNVFVAAYHWHPAIGNTLTFFATNDPLGLSLTRTVVAGERVGTSDVWVGVLDAPLPGTYAPLPILDEPIADSTAFDNASIADADVFMFGRSDDVDSSVTNIAVGKNRLDHWLQSVTVGGTTDSAIAAIEQISSDSGFVDFEAFLILHDSGGPLLADLNGTLTLIGINWFTGTIDIQPGPGTKTRNYSGFSYLGNYAVPVNAIIEGMAENPTSGYLSWMPGAFSTADGLAETGPAIDFDRDGVINLLEYAFVLDPESGASAQVAVPNLGESGPDRFLEASLDVRVDSQLSYFIQTGSNLAGWQSVALTFDGLDWQSADPLKVAILSTTDHGNGTWTLLLRDPNPLISGIKRFLLPRVEVVP